MIGVPTVRAAGGTAAAPNETSLTRTSSVNTTVWLLANLSSVVTMNAAG